jgi:hypothetical protein
MNTGTRLGSAGREGQHEYLKQGIPKIGFGPHFRVWNAFSQGGNSCGHRFIAKKSLLRNYYSS